jgi:hypothetical protein
MTYTRKITYTVCSQMVQRDKNHKSNGGIDDKSRLTTWHFLLFANNVYITAKVSVSARSASIA